MSMQSKNMIDHEFIIFGVEHYNPLGVIRSLGEMGIAAHYIVSEGRHPISDKSKYLKSVTHMKDFDEGFRFLVERFGNADEDKLPFIITCDDHAMEYLDNKYDEIKDHFILFNANGVSGRVTKYMDKFEILETAKRNGLKVLDTRVLEKGDIPDDLDYPVITKSISPNVGGWKSDVFICENKEELEEAYKKIKSPQVLVQKFINKKNEYCIDGFSINHGRDTVITIAATYNYLIKGYYSPYMTLTNFNKADLETGIRSLLKDIGYEGIWCIEFLIDEDDTYYFTEINLRNSGWSYASTVAGMNMPYLWAKSTLNGTLDDSYVMIQEGFTAMVEPIDYQKRVVEGTTKFSEWLQDFKDSDCGFYYSKDDPAPFIEMVDNWEKLN